MPYWGKTGFNLPNPIDYGARPGADATAAIQAAIDDAISADAGGVFLPGNVWEISRAPGGGIDYCLRINAATDFRFVGTGWASVLKLANGNLGNSDLSLVKLEGGCERILFEDVVFNGNRANVTNLREFYGLNIESAFDSIFSGLRFIEMPANVAQTNGAMRIGKGAGGDTCSQIITSDLSFVNGNGVAMLVADVEAVLASSAGIISGFVDGVVLETTPVGTAPRDYSFSGWLIDVTDYAFLATIAPGNIAQRVRMSGLVVQEGRVVVDNADDVIISDAVFDGKVSGECVVVREAVGDVSVANTVFLRSDAFLVEASGVSRPESVSIRESMIVMDGAGFALRVEGGEELTLDTLHIVAPGGVASQFLDVPMTSDIDVITLRSCQLLGGSTVSPIKIAPGGNAIGEIIITNNRIDGDATKAAIDFVAATGGGSYDNVPLIIDNDVTALEVIASAAFANFPYPAYVAGGNARTDGTPAQYCGTKYVCLGTPELNVPGYKGDQTFRVDGGAGTTWYVKETDGGNTGWAVK